MPIKINLNEFGIDTENIPEEVDKKYHSLPPKSKELIDKTYGSARNLIAVLYQLWFIEKLEKSEIAEKLNIQTENVHIQLYNLSWYYSNDYSKNATLFDDDIKNTRKLFENAKIKSLLLNADSDEFNKLKETIKTAQGFRKKTYLNLGFHTSEEYARTMYYLIYINHLSPIKLIPLFNFTFGTIQSRLQALGLNLSHEQGIANKKGRKSHNYIKSENSKKKTVARKQANTYSISSDPENYVRIQTSNSIYDYIDSKRYEVIVGVSQTGILGSLEIDIPIIIYDLITQQIFRFAVEYNDDFRHSAVRDENKKNQAENNGWIYLDILHKGRVSNNLRLLDPKIRDLCEEIKNTVELNKSIKKENE